MTSRPRVLVFQPLVSAGAPHDYRLLGLQFWLADRFNDVGFEGASALFRDAESGRLISMTPPPDDQIQRALLDNAAQYGLLTSFAVLGGQPHIAVARLFRAQRGHPLRTLARWKFEGDSEHLPGAAHRLLIEAASRLGVVLAPTTWMDVFETHDATAANNFLAALGCHSVADQGGTVEKSEGALQAILSAISGGMAPAIKFFPHLITSLRTSGSAPREMLSAAIHAALDMVASAPASWQPVIRELVPERTTLPN